MGLDQSAYVVNGNIDNEDNHEEFAYWRKHNRLQGWMENRWHNYYKNIENFNCVNFYLSINDIDDLEKAINSRELPETTGFFYGGDSYEDYDDPEWGYKEEDQKFIAQAREFLNDGKQIYYHCWY